MGKNENVAQKKYMSLGSKWAYGIGNLGSVLSNNVISSFVMLYLANAVGLNTSIIGMLMMVSKVFDGISDLIFGGLIDRTNSKMGHARPWIIYTTIPLNIFLVLLFCVPQTESWLSYAYFFIIYTLMEAVWYTANQISYTTLPILATKSQSERVTLSVIGMTFALVANIVISGVTVTLTEILGGGTAGWRNMAIIYGAISTACLLICGFGVKELPYESSGDTKRKMSAAAIIEGLKNLLKNHYYLWLLLLYIIIALTQAITSAVGAFYYSYVLNDSTLMGTFTLLGCTTFFGLLVAPGIVKKFGLYKANLWASIISIVLSAIYIPIAYTQNISLMLLMTGIKSVPAGIYTASLGALVGDVAEFSWLRDHVHVEAMLSSCSSLGYKIGTGLGTALGGVLITWSGYEASLAIQSADTLGRINFSMVVLPTIISAFIILVFYKCNMQKEIEAIKNRNSGGNPTSP